MDKQKGTAIHVAGLTAAYDENIVLDDVRLDVEIGDYLGIIGPNGGGKSTLLKAIMGLIEVRSGEISILGTSIREGRNQIGYVPQSAEFDRSFPINVVQVVLTGMLSKKLQAFRRYSEQEKEHALSLLDNVGIRHLAQNHISALSGGEFQKMLIARALASDPKILLLDEPTASVDASSRAQIYDLLDKLNDTVTIILVTHDLLAVSSRVRRLACLNSKLIYHGEPELNEDIVSNLYGCPVDLIAHGVPHRVLKEHGGDSCEC